MRLIDADKLQEEFKELHGGKRSLLIDTQPTADVVEVDKAQKEIDYWHDKAQSYEQTILKLSLNKADVVEVVRCKDCRWYERDIFDREAGVCFNPNKCTKTLGFEVLNEDYCSYGERADA